MFHYCNVVCFTILKDSICDVIFLYFSIFLLYRNLLLIKQNTLILFKLVSGQPLLPNENCPPVRVRGWVRVSFGVGAGGNFPQGQLS